MHTIDTQYLLNYMGCLMGKSSALWKRSNFTQMSGSSVPRGIYQAGESISESPHHMPSAGKQPHKCVPQVGKWLYIHITAHFTLFFLNSIWKWKECKKKTKHSLAWKVCSRSFINKSFPHLFSEKSLKHQGPWRSQCNCPHLYLILLTVLINLKHMIGNLFWSRDCWKYKRVVLDTEQNRKKKPNQDE